jgi:hypothetical protein
MTLFPPLAGAWLSLVLLLSLPAAPALAETAPIPLAETGAWCLAPNTSCADGPWWLAQPQLGVAPRGQTTYVGLDGLGSDPDFAEAVRLLWQWPEGRQQLIGAAALGVQIRQGRRLRGADSDSFATYDDEALIVEVAYENMDVPTWMLTDLLVHELRHANDLGSSPSDWDSVEGCFSLEQRAYEAEKRYMLWLQERFGPLPSEDEEWEAGLTVAADDLYANMMDLHRLTDVVSVVHDDYADTCVA